jgi:hypothetical protein
MHPKASGLIATGRDHPSVPQPTDQEGPLHQTTVQEPLTGDEEGIQIEMENGGFHKNIGFIPITWKISKCTERDEPFQNFNNFAYLNTA